MPDKIRLGASTKWCVVGDSITVGQAASSYSAKGYMQRLAAYTGLVLQNDAVSAKGAYRATLKGFAYQTHGAYRDVTFLWAAGHNDVIYGAANFDKKIASELLSYLLTCWAKTCVAANDGSFTKTGTWNTGGGIGEKCSALSQPLIWSATNGSKISGSFSGDNLVIRCFNGNGTTGNRIRPFTVKIDGVLTVTHAGDGESDGDHLESVGLTHHAVFIDECGAGSHNFEIEVQSGTGAVYIDTIETVRAPNNCERVLVLDPPRPNNYPAVGPGTATAADFDAADAAIAGVLTRLANYPVARVRTNDFLDPSHMNVDHEHPDDLGHLDMFHGCLAAIDP